ncbi:leukocyte elastase inhibitor-like [Antedon mediterranea]|uniref:leukocyte elastase inhibitor-like n=1 Tax=Antedon mediterranea TaxID=105859 RepID=UPI003AF46C42
MVHQVKCVFLYLLSVLFTTTMATQSTSSFENLSDLANSSNEFSLDLYKTILPTAKGKNIFFSPVSITTALSMTYMGARGETANQMRDVLHYNDIDENKLHQSFYELNGLLYGSEEAYTLKSANRLFTHQGFSILEEYRQQTKAHYLSKLETHNFVEDGAGAVNAINSWVEGETNGKIKDLLKEIDPLTRLILVNAVYFKGNWLNQFDMENTHKGVFHVSSNEKVNCDLMFQKRHFNITYDSGNKCLVLDLPYKGNDLSMLIVLPDDTDGLALLERKLSASLLQSWTSTLRHDKVELYLPKFSLTEEFQLNDVLIKMGMGHLFDEVKADLSGISTADQLHVSEVLHKAFVDVNEEGSEAAAATSVRLSTRSIERNTQFRADHPFLFIIRDRRTEMALFMGRMAKPQNTSDHDEL